MNDTIKIMVDDVELTVETDPEDGGFAGLLAADGEDADPAEHGGVANVMAEAAEAWELAREEAY